MTFQYFASQRRKCFVKDIFRPKNIVFFNSHRTMQYIHDRIYEKLTPLLNSLLPISFYILSEKLNLTSSNLLHSELRRRHNRQTVVSEGECSYLDSKEVLLSSNQETARIHGA